MEAGKRKRDPERRRQEILDAAAAIIVERGAAALTHRAIAARAGVAVGSTTRYFESIDDLREAALRMIGDQIDTSLVQIERELSVAPEPAERIATLMHEFLLDFRQVRGYIALVTAATTDLNLRSLGLRWTDRSTDILAGYVGRERAIAIQTYLDGTLIHAALHDHPIDRVDIERVVRALSTMSDNEVPESCPN